MAIERVKKISLIVPKSEKEKLLTRLQRQGFFHLEQVSLEEERLAEEEGGESETSLREELSQVHFCLRFLSSFTPPKGFIQSFFKPRLKVSKRRIESMEKQKFSYFYEDCERLDRRLSEINHRLEEIENLSFELEPWLSFPLPLNGYLSSSVGFFLLALSPVVLKRLEEEIEEEDLIWLEVVAKSEKKFFAVLFFHNLKKDELEKILAKLEIEKVVFPTDLTPSKWLKKLLAEKQRLLKEKKKLEDKAQKYLKYLTILRLKESYLKARLSCVQARSKMVATERVVFLEGWVKETDLKKLARLLHSTHSAYEMIVSDPSPADNPPVILKNKPFFKPFEILVELYGLPSYWEIDPTPFLAFTFLLFFGLAIGDAGYAILLFFLVNLLSLKLPFSEKSRQFLKIFSYGSLPAFLVGVLTGSWFGLPVQSLPPFLRQMMILDPLKGSGPVVFLVFTLILGFLHLISGLVVEAIDNLKKGNWQSALLDQLGTALFLVGAFLYIVVFFKSVGGRIPSWSPVAKALLLAGAAIIVIFANRESKSWLGRIGGGLYSLYGMSGYLGDTISYSRLMALGLATVLIGFSFNLIIQPLWGYGWLGALVALPIFLALHLANLAINLIGAFVHPLRLHYVEFFKQFYENGGKKFEPLSLESEGVILEK